MSLWNPVSDKWVYFDDCRLSDGAMIDAKGTGYADMLLQNPNGYPWKGIQDGFIEQANRQQEAAGARPIEWHFAEPQVADYVREIFKNNDLNILMTPRFRINSYWGPRRESPQQLAVRYQQMLDALSAIDPVLRHWIFVGRKKPVPQDQLGKDGLAELIAEKVARADDGDPTPINGYLLSAYTNPSTQPISLGLRVHAGMYAVANFLINSAAIETQRLCEENASLIALEVFKPAMLAIAAAWDVTWCAAYPSDLMDLWATPKPHRPLFKLAWVSYLSARFAPMVTPPPSAIVERPPGGGLLMIATGDRFDISNPQHLAVARDIEAALAPVNALPWPPDATP